MTATCPNNHEHDTFLTTAHVMEEWKVNREGNFIETTETLEVTHKPRPDNLWTCSECGAEADLHDYP